jgi:type III pantothenate kinase
MFSRTPDPLGRNTQAAIESGLYWGHVGAVRELIFRQRDRLANFDKAKDAPSLLLFTGGAAPLLAPHFAHARFEPHLALQGLAVVCEQSRTAE